MYREIIKHIKRDHGKRAQKVVPGRSKSVTTVTNYKVEGQNVKPQHQLSFAIFSRVYVRAERDEIEGFSGHEKAGWKSVFPAETSAINVPDK